MRRRAVTIVQATKILGGPGGAMAAQVEIVRVHSVTTTLEDVYNYLREFNATRVVVLFENEEPEGRNGTE